MVFGRDTFIPQADNKDKIQGVNLDEMNIVSVLFAKMIQNMYVIMMLCI